MVAIDETQTAIFERMLLKLENDFFDSGKTVLFAQMPVGPRCQCSAVLVA